jgi:hypothetical protein
MAVDSQSMQRVTLKILIKRAIKAEQRFKDVDDSDKWHKACVHFELIEALSEVRGVAYVRYGCASSRLYHWTRRYYAMPRQFDCCKQI